MLRGVAPQRYALSPTGVVGVYSLRPDGLGEDFGISYADYMPKPPFGASAGNRCRSALVTYAQGSTPTARGPLPFGL